MSGVTNLYRRNVGLMLIAPDRRIFVGRRAQKPKGQPDAWQMPQGGVDADETPLLRESAKWLTYDVPEKARPAHWKGRWVGQAQRWFALAFTGRDADIDIAAHDQEFDAWQWMTAAEMLDRIVPFKRPTYDAVVEEFRDLVK